MSVDASLVGARAAADQASAFYRNHLDNVVSTYASCLADYPANDPGDILGIQVKALMNGEYSRIELCNVLAIAIDRLARGGA